MHIDSILLVAPVSRAPDNVIIIIAYVLLSAWCKNRPHLMQTI